jgi:large subunit ribosomal protein L20
MPRAGRAQVRRKRTKKLFQRSKGFFLGRRNLRRTATNAVHKALLYATRDRKNRKRTFRRLWITRIGAAARQHGLSYSRFTYGLKLAGVELDRKMLSGLAIEDPAAFGAVAQVAKEALAAHS